MVLAMLTMAGKTKYSKRLISISNLPQVVRMESVFHSPILLLLKIGRLFDRLELFSLSKINPRQKFKL